MLSSRWSTWFRIPVAAPAVIVYAVILAASLHIGPGAPLARRRKAWMILFTAAVLAAAAAVWFGAVQCFFVRAWCRYCVIVHACGLTVGTIVVLAAPLGRGRWLPDEPPGVPQDPILIRPLAAGGAVAFAVAMIAMLVAGQTLVQRRTHRVSGGDSGVYRTASDTVIVLIEGLLVKLRPADYPTLGPPGAEHLLVSFFDYTCTHCRQMHAYLLAAHRRYGDQMAVVMVPVPLEARCNPTIKQTNPVHHHACTYARLAYGVWKADPAQFETYDRWLFDPVHPPPPDVARNNAESRVGAEPLAAVLRDGWPDHQIARNIELFTTAHLDRLPIIVGSMGILKGLAPDAAELFDLIEEHSTLRPVAVAPSGAG